MIGGGLSGLGCGRGATFGITGIIAGGEGAPPLADDEVSEGALGSWVINRTLIIFFFGGLNILSKRFQTKGQAIIKMWTANAVCKILNRKRFETCPDIASNIGCFSDSV